VIFSSWKKKEGKKIKNQDQSYPQESNCQTTGIIKNEKREVVGKEDSGGDKELYTGGKKSTTTEAPSREKGERGLKGETKDGKLHVL